MVKVVGWLRKETSNPQFRAFEQKALIWAFRAAYAYLAVRLGIGAEHAAIG